MVDNNVFYAEQQAQKAHNNPVQRSSDFNTSQRCGKAQVDQDERAHHSFEVGYEQEEDDSTHEHQMSVLKKIPLRPTFEEPKSDSQQQVNNSVKKALAAHKFSDDLDPAPLPMTKFGAALKADSMFGWKPQPQKMDVMPIPLCFGLVEYNLDDLIKPEKILYLGPRYQNSIKLHERFANKVLQVPQMKRNQETGKLERDVFKLETYPFKMPKITNGVVKYEDAFQGFSQSMAQNDQKYNQQKRQLHMNQCQPETPIQNTLPLKFDSDFESGNLDLSARTFLDRNDEYDLVMRLDSNSRTHQQWFYFSTDTNNRGNYLKQTVRFNVLNFTKPYSLYQNGMQPMIWSERLYEEKGIGWFRGGKEVQYRRSRLKRVGYRNPCQCLSFEYTYLYENDKVYFAYGIPYTFSMMSSFIAHVSKLQQHQKDSQIFQTETLGHSLSGVAIPLITITDFKCKQNKKTIVINGRVHPGETTASWVLHGFMRFLLSKAPLARQLRKRAIFKIIPIMNVDGVIAGNYRTSLAGLDINRMFGENANKRLNPESTLLKELALKEKKIAFYFDVHGHSSKKSVFMYGPRFPLHSEHYLKIRLIPKLVQARTPIFRYYSCRFANEKSKQNCSRLALSRELPLPTSYTIEVSMWGWLDKETRKTVDLDLANLMSFGRGLVSSIADWFILLDKHKLERIKRAVQMSSHKKPQAKRQLVDIIGTEDFEEYKEEIDVELKKAAMAKKSVSIGGGVRGRRKSSAVGQNRSDHLNRDLSGLPAAVQSKKGGVGSEMLVVETDSEREGGDETTDQQFKNGMPQQSSQQGTTVLEQEVISVGFDLHPMCGFEWLHPVQPKPKEPKQKRKETALLQSEGGEGPQDGSTEGTIYGDLDYDDFDDDDLQFAGMNNRLEDIYQDIKVDLVRAQQIQQQRKKQQSKGGKHTDSNKDIDFEEELDSQKGFSSDEEDEPEVLDQELEELKILDCMMSFFHHVEQGEPSYQMQPQYSQPHTLSTRRPQTATKPAVTKLTSGNPRQFTIKPREQHFVSPITQAASVSALETIIKVKTASNPNQSSAGVPRHHPQQYSKQLQNLQSQRELSNPSDTAAPKNIVPKEKKQLQPFVHKIAVRRVEKKSYPTAVIKTNTQTVAHDPVYKLVPPVELLSQLQPRQKQNKASMQDESRNLMNEQLHTAMSKNSYDYISHLKQEFKHGNLKDKQFLQLVQEHEQATLKVQQEQEQRRQEKLEAQRQKQVDAEQQAVEEAKTKLWYQQQLWIQLAKFAQNQQPQPSTVLSQSQEARYVKVPQNATQAAQGVQGPHAAKQELDAHRRFARLQSGGTRGGNPHGTKLIYQKLVGPDRSKRATPSNNLRQSRGQQLTGSTARLPSSQSRPVLVAKPHDPLIHIATHFNGEKTSFVGLSTTVASPKIFNNTRIAQSVSSPPSAQPQQYHAKSVEESALLTAVYHQQAFMRQKTQPAVGTIGVRQHLANKSPDLHVQRQSATSPDCSSSRQPVKRPNSQVAPGSPAAPGQSQQRASLRPAAQPLQRAPHAGQGAESLGRSAQQHPQWFQPHYGGSPPSERPKQLHNQLSNLNSAEWSLSVSTAAHAPHISSSQITASQYHSAGVSLTSKSLRVDKLPKPQQNAVPLLLIRHPKPKH